MDFEKMTERVRSALQASQTLAMRHNHQQLRPEHLLKCMMDDDSGILPKLIRASGGKENKLKRSLEEAIAKNSVVKGAGAQSCLLYTSPSPRDRG